MRAGDAVAAARRRLPMTPMAAVELVGANGKVPLHDVFEGRKMLLAYFFMWNRGAPHHRQCEGCSPSRAELHSLPSESTPHASPVLFDAAVREPLGSPTGVCSARCRGFEIPTRLAEIVRLTSKFDTPTRNPEDPRSRRCSHRASRLELCRLAQAWLNSRA
ncbi:MAG: DUF899 family protein [Deltaproteobacteria bacterium]